MEELTEDIPQKKVNLSFQTRAVVFNSPTYEPNLDQESTSNNQDEPKTIEEEKIQKEKDTTENDENNA